MTETEVTNLLGRPLFTAHDKPDETRFFYGGFHRFRWCTMDIFFDTNKTVINKFHDH